MNQADFIACFQTDLWQLGLPTGSTAMVHSSLRAFGQVPGGADTVIEALLASLGDAGTLLMPALSYMSVTPSHPVFDLRTTPSCVGIIPEAFRQRAGVHRSMHPTHSVCGLGRLAAELLSGHDRDQTPCGAHSPFHRLPETDGFILMLGCGLEPNTSMHAVEELVTPPYLFSGPIVYTLTNAEGHTRQKEYIPHGFRGWAQRYDRIANLLSAPDLRTGNVANAPCHLIRAKALWSAALAALRQDPLYFVEPTKEP